MKSLNTSIKTAFSPQPEIQNDFPNEITSKLENESNEMLHADSCALNACDDITEVVHEIIKQPQTNKKRVRVDESKNEVHYIYPELHTKRRRGKLKLKRLRVSKSDISLFKTKITSDEKSKTGQPSLPLDWQYTHQFPTEQSPAVSTPVPHSNPEKPSPSTGTQSTP